MDIKEEKIKTIELLGVDDLKLIFKWYPNHLNDYAEKSGFNLLAFCASVVSGDVYIDDTLQNLLGHSVNWEKLPFGPGVGLNKTGYEVEGLLCE